MSVMNRKTGRRAQGPEFRNSSQIRNADLVSVTSLFLLERISCQY